MEGRVSVQECLLVGAIKPLVNLTGSVRASVRLAVVIRSNAVLVGHVALPVGYDKYTGDYVVKPEFQDRVLETSQKLMSSDVAVKAIEVQRVSNAAGGRTVYIGGLING